MHESDTAESLMPGRLVAGLWTLNSGRRSNRALLIQPGSQFFDNFEIPSSSNGRTLRSEREVPRLRSGFRQQAGTPAMRLKFESTGGSRSYGLSAGWLIVSQQGRVQLPLAPP